MSRHHSLIPAAALLLAACAGGPRPQTEPDSMPPTAPVPPIATVRPFEVDSPNGKRVDEYYWLRDDGRSKPEVIAYLEAENAYKAAMTAHAKALEDKVYAEIVARIKQDDSTVPYRKRGHWYYTRFETGKEYPVYARKAASLEAPEQVMLDGNAMAAGHDFFEIGAMAIAPDNRLLAYAEDTVGRRQYTLRVRDLETGETLPDRIENADPYLAWTADSGSFLYVEKHPETLLGYRVRRHVLGTDPAQDALVYEQDDESFYTSVGVTKDERYVLIHARSTVSTEYRYADAADPALAWRVFLPRERDHEYYVDHFDGRWIIRSNWQAPNFRLLEATVGEEGDRATTPSSTASTCSASSSRSRSAAARCGRSASGPGAAATTSSSRRTSRRTRRRSGRMPRSTRTSCATTTSPWRRPRPSTTTTSRPASASS
jgi:oligopeptidase B